MQKIQALDAMQIEVRPKSMLSVRKSKDKRKLLMSFWHSVIYMTVQEKVARSIYMFRAAKLLRTIFQSGERWLFRIGHRIKARGRLNCCANKRPEDITS